MKESKLAFKDDWMFYLEKSLVKFFRSYNIIFEIIDEDDDNWFEINYTYKLIINGQNFIFIFTESLDNDSEPCKLVYHNDIAYVGGMNIFNKIVELVKPNLIIHEINQIEKELTSDEKIIEQIEFEIKGDDNFSLPADIAFLCF